MIRRTTAAVLLGLVGALLLGSPAAAHPLGNFTTNQYAGLRVTGSGVDIDYVLDLAELPTYQARRSEIDANRDGVLAAAENDAYAARTCSAAAAAGVVTVGGKTVALAGSPAGLTFPAGAGGLSTLRLECILHAQARISGATTVGYRSSLYAERIGWREITAVGDRFTLTASDVPAGSWSGRLTAYPKDVVSSDVRSATLSVRPGGPAAAPLAGAVRSGKVDRLSAWFTELVGRPQLTLGVGVLAFLVAVVLGGVHAVAPGHGKTIMAAYLVGSRGRLGHALTVAGTVAATHTLGVLALGVLLATSLQLAPDRIYDWLRLASGLLVALVGANLLHHAIRRLRTRPASSHTHTHTHAPGHSADHSHPHSPDPDPAHAHSDEPNLALAHSHEPNPAHAHAHHRPHRHNHAEPQSIAHGHAHPHDHDHAHPHDHDHPRSPDHDHPQDHDHDHGGGDGQLVLAGHRDGARHDRGQAHAPAAEPLTHSHGGWEHTHHLPDPDEPLRMRTLLAMGFAGGLSPSPSAVVVLLGAVALGRAWYGVLLVLAYGIGLAATLIGIGFALAHWGERLHRVRAGRWSRLLTHRLPTVTATVIVLVGVGMTVLATTSLLH